MCGSLTERNTRPASEVCGIAGVEELVYVEGILVLNWGRKVVCCVGILCPSPPPPLFFIGALVVGK